MMLQNPPRWNASVYCVVPTSVPPKLKSAFLRIGDWAIIWSGTLADPAKTAGVGHRRVRGNVTAPGCDYSGVKVDRSADPMKLQNQRDNLCGNADSCARTMLIWVAAYDHALVQKAITRGNDFVVPHRQLITAARSVGNDSLSLFS